MARRVNLDLERASHLALAHIGDPLAPDGELDVPPLPRELPEWARDAIAVSTRARELLARLRPIVVRVLTFWDHRMRSIALAGHKLRVDPSGSYRLD